MLNVGTHASSASVKGAPKARSISGVPTGVPPMSWIVQQHDQTKASITVLAPDFFDMILVVNLESNQKQTKANQHDNTIKWSQTLGEEYYLLDWIAEKKAVRGESMHSSRWILSLHHRAVLFLSGRRVQRFTTGSPKWSKSKFICLFARHLMPGARVFDLIDLGWKWIHCPANCTDVSTSRYTCIHMHLHYFKNNGCYNMR